MKKRWIVIIIIFIFLMSTVTVGLIVSKVETVKYKTIKSQDNIEIRLYEPTIIAKVHINGNREDAIKKGFTLLSDYIFGNNLIKQDIPMTTPVQQKYIGDYWQISFIMPSKYNIDTLPKPKNESVIIQNIPPQQFIVIRFAGKHSDSNIQKQEKKLMQYIQSNNISVVGAPKYAFYNPPWTLPFMRRNEIMIEIQ